MNPIVPVSPPTPAFRRKSWRLLQLALDPLGNPSVLPAPPVAEELRVEATLAG